jgi:hypothetical protein
MRLSSVIIICVILFGSKAHASSKLMSESAVTSEAWTSELSVSGKTELSTVELGYALSGETSGSGASQQNVAAASKYEASASLLAKVWGNPKLYGLYNNSLAEKTTTTSGTVSGSVLLGSSSWLNISPSVGMSLYTAQILSKSSSGGSSGRRGQGRTASGGSSSTPTVSTKNLTQTSYGANIGLIINENNIISLYGTRYSYDTDLQTFLASTRAGTAGLPMGRSSQALLAWLSLFSRESYGLNLYWKIFSDWSTSIDVFRVVSAISNQASDYATPSIKWQFHESHASEIQHERTLNSHSVDNWTFLLISDWSNSFSTEAGITYDVIPTVPVFGGVVTISYSL